jgi:PST family polysaccharide transporter
VTESFSSPSTHKRFLRAALASGLSQGWRVVLTFGATLALRRFISREDWGLFTLVLVIFMILGAIRDLGLAYHVLRTKTRPFGNLLLVEALWGGLLSVGVFVAAPWWVDLYGLVNQVPPHPEMVGVIRGMTVFLFFEGLATVPRNYFDSELATHRTVLAEVVRNLVFVVFSVGLALSGAGVWSLVIGHAAGTVLYAVLLWIRAWRVMPLVFERGKTLALIRVSLPLAFIWFLLILTRYIDPLVIGLWHPLEDIGEYGFSYDWAMIVSVQVLMPAVGRVLYPALVAFSSKTRQLFQAYSIATRFVLTFEVASAGVLFLNAEFVLRLAGGSQWQDAPTYLRVLCFAPLIDPFSRLGGEVLKTRHQDRLWIIATLATVISFGVGGLLLTSRYGPIGMAWANFAQLGGLIMAWALYRLDPVGFKQLCVDLLVLYVASVPAFAAAAAVPASMPILRFAASCSAAAVTLAVAGWRFGPEAVAFFRQRPTAPAA